MTAAITTQPFPWRRYLLALLGIVLVATWPVLSIVVTGIIADANGCAVDEGSAHPCLMFGQDWGDMLYAGNVFGWFMLITLPLGAVLLTAWLCVVVVQLFKRRRVAVQ